MSTKYRLTRLATVLMIGAFCILVWTLIVAAFLAAVRRAF